MSQLVISEVIQEYKIAMKNINNVTFRTREEVISDLKTLVRQPGYIYSLCLILFEDFHVHLEALDTINHRERISRSRFYLGTFGSE